MSGPQFRDYHLLLDEQAGEIFARTDEIAERARKLGASPLRSIGEIHRRQRLVDNDKARVPAIAMLRELHGDNLAMVAALKELKALADAAGDNATSGALDAWTNEVERRAWFLQEIAQD